MNRKLERAPYITGYRPSKIDDSQMFHPNEPTELLPAKQSRLIQKHIEVSAQMHENQVEITERKRRETKSGFIGVQASLPPAAPGQLISKPYCICKWLSQPNTLPDIL